MSFDIDDFSSYFCLIFSTPVIIPPELDLKSFQKQVRPELFSEVFSVLYEMFGEEFKMTIRKCLAAKTTYYRSFMEMVVAKGVKMSEETTYTRFLLVCVLIHGIISASFKNEDCFMIANVCHCCLVTIYSRCYENLFESKWKEYDLNFHLVALKKLLNTQKSLDGKRKLPLFGESHIDTIIKSLDDAVKVSLSDADLDLLETMLSFSPSRFFDDRSTPSGSPLSLDASTDGARENTAVQEPEFSPFKSSPTKDIDEVETAYTPIYEDSSKSTNMSSGSEPPSSSTDTDEDSKRFVPLSKDYLYYKNRMCAFCPGTCAMSTVTIVERKLKESGK